MLWSSPPSFLDCAPVYDYEPGHPPACVTKENEHEPCETFNEPSKTNADTFKSRWNFRRNCDVIPWNQETGPLDLSSAVVVPVLVTNNLLKPWLTSTCSRKYKFFLLPYLFSSSASFSSLSWMTWFNAETFSSFCLIFCCRRCDEPKDSSSSKTL